ncbi:FAD-binding oxidoreductase [Sphingomonas oligophenolica]|uniref:NAD(P)/FAD-dependent oxidoreductase n=1 Tax=Sphingomonas oligophenolica TaxID=301154 RepID=UPI0031D5C04E
MSNEVVVLGAGMVGTATALALQARGYDVVLLDRNEPGSETSYGNAGVIQGEACEPYALPRDIATLWRIARKTDNSVDWDLPGLWRLAPSLFTYWRNSAPARHRRTSLAYAALIRRATRDHAGWIAASASEALIRREGYRLIFRDSASFEVQARKAEKWRALYGIGYDREDSAALAIAEPALRRPLAGAIRWHDAWTCSDPGALVKAYAAYFGRRGGSLVKADLCGLEQSGRGWRVLSSAGPIETENVVVALGPWSPQALEPLGYRVSLIRKRGYHMHVEYPRADADPSNTRLNLLLIDAAIGAVYAPMRAGLRVATGADLSAIEPDGMPRQLERAYAAARDLLDLGAPVANSRWAGMRPCTPDMLPLVGAAPRHRGLWFNFGHGHQGFTLGPTTGNLLAGVMAGDSVDDVLPLAPSRLATA